jgi:hypothetical protein
MLSEKRESGFREKRIWFQRKESLVSKKRESAIEI